MIYADVVRRQVPHMSLHSRLRIALGPWQSAPHWHVAFSGGLDSTVLLHLLASLRDREPLPPITAVHVHHGLQPAADAWPKHCGAICESLGVPLDVLQVQVERGASLEGKAREARYRALGSHLPVGGVLLTAQHRDDQVETVLFRLLRGAGVQGLSGMPFERPLARGVLLRPLLECSRDELEVYAHEHGLAWVEDPSNGSLDHARNYLRHRLLPVMRERWPQADASVARAARHCAEAQLLLDDLAAVDLQAARVPPRLDWLPIPSLDLPALAMLAPARQRNALRCWLRTLTRLPDHDHWVGWDALRDAACDATPIWRLGDGELHRGGDRLWWLSGAWLQRLGPERVDISPGVQTCLEGNGSVRLVGAGVTGTLQVRYRRGGERMSVPRRGHRDLKRLLNEAGVPGFARARLPLLFLDDELIALANLPQFDARGLSLSWTPPSIPGLS